MTKTHITENGYGFDVYLDENGNEICRSGTGMTNEEKRRVDACVLFAFLDELAAEGLTWAEGKAKYGGDIKPKGYNLTIAR